MQKILTLMIFFVTLMPAFDANLTAHAQSMGNELLDEVYCYGHHTPTTWDIIGYLGSWINDYDYDDSYSNGGGGSGGGSHNLYHSTTSNDISNEKDDSKQTEDANTKQQKGYLESAMNWLKEYLPKDLYNMVKTMKDEGKIILTTDEKAQYDPNTGCINFGIDVCEEALMHEVIHLLQDKNGMLNYDKCSSNNEYQTYMLNYIIQKCTGASGSKVPTLERGSDTYMMFIQNQAEYFGRDSKGFWYSQSLINVLNENDSAWSKTFKEGAQRMNYPEGYYKNYDSKYDYNWEKLFDSVGFRKK